MEQEKKKGKSFCSRCKAIHADGTLRFCSDCGGRLVPVEGQGVHAPSGGGMFSRLIRRDETDDVEFESFGGASAPATAPAASPRETTELSSGGHAPATSGTPQDDSASIGTGSLKFETLDPPARPTPEQVAHPASSIEPKMLIGKKISERFLVDELLAGGPGRSTYTAVDLQTNSKVLVQMFPGEAFDARQESHLYGEALRNAARFRDEDFAVVLGSGRLPDGRVVIISEYVEGNSIAQVIGFAGAFDVNRAARLVRKIADAIKEAHEYGVFHGSLRAENIVLLRPEDLQDKIKIIGLGVAFADGETLLGGLPSAADDTYDLAVIAYQMLTGRNPFSGTVAGDSSSLGTVVPVCSVRSELPQQVDDVLNKAMSRISADRYVDIRDFGDAFYAALTGGMVSGRATPQPEQLHEEPVRSDRMQVKELFVNEAPVAETSVPDRELFGQEEKEPSGKPRLLIAAVFVLVLLAVGGYLIYRYQSPVSAPTLPAGSIETKNTDGPIAPRDLARPEGADVFVNKKEKLPGDLAKSFIPFQVFYPQKFVKGDSKKNFVELSQKSDAGVPVESFIVTSYSSDGTFEKDKGNFPKLVERSNSELRAILGEGYRAVSQSETSIQDGRLKAYEVRFEYAGSLSGRDTKLWGRRLWIPLQKSDAKAGFVVTILASDLSSDVKGLDDLGSKGSLKMILDSFEPGK